MQPTFSALQHVEGKNHEHFGTIDHKHDHDQEERHAIQGKRIDDDKIRRSNATAKMLQPINFNKLESARIVIYDFIVQRRRQFLAAKCMKDKFRSEIEHRIAARVEQANIKRLAWAAQKITLLLKRKKNKVAIKCKSVEEQEAAKKIRSIIEAKLEARIESVRIASACTIVHFFKQFVVPKAHFKSKSRTPVRQHTVKYKSAETIKSTMENRQSAAKTIINFIHQRLASHCDSPENQARAQHDENKKSQRKHVEKVATPPKKALSATSNAKFLVKDQLKIVAGHHKARNLPMPPKRAPKTITQKSSSSLPKSSSTSFQRPKQNLASASKPKATLPKSKILLEKSYQDTKPKSTNQKSPNLRNRNPTEKRSPSKPHILTKDNPNSSNNAVHKSTSRLRESIGSINALTSQLQHQHRRTAKSKPQIFTKQKKPILPVKPEISHREPAPLHKTVPKHNRIKISTKSTTCTSHGCPNGRQIQGYCLAHFREQLSRVGGP